MFESEIDFAFIFRFECVELSFRKHTSGLTGIDILYNNYLLLTSIPQRTWYYFSVAQ